MWYVLTNNNCAPVKLIKGGGIDFRDALVAQNTKAGVSMRPCGVFIVPSLALECLCWVLMKKLKKFISRLLAVCDIVKLSFQFIIGPDVMIIKIIPRFLFGILIILAPIASSSGFFGSPETNGFYKTRLDDGMENVGEMIRHCDISRKKLALVNFKYRAKDGTVRGDGGVVVRSYLSDNTIAIFKELFELGFIVLKDKDSNPFVLKSYGSAIKSLGALGFFCGDDFGMVDKNLSNSSGIFLDINVQSNPYFIKTSESTVYIAGDMSFITKTPEADASIIGGQVVDLFAKYGFTEWGGGEDFINQFGGQLVLLGRFGLSNELHNFLEELEDDDASRVMKILSTSKGSFSAIKGGTILNDLLLIYKNNKKDFFKILGKNINNIVQKDFDFLIQLHRDLIIDKR